MAKQTPRLVVKQHHPARLLIVLLALVIGMMIAAWLLFEYGRSRAGTDYERYRTELAHAQKELDEARKVITRLRELKVILERTRDIERKGYDDIGDTLKALQDEVLELKEEVAFYRSIVAPRESSRGLRIQSFRLEPSGQERGYRYKLVLTQVMKNNRITRGKVSMKLDGYQDGGPKALTLADITVNRKDTLAFRFKYFQNLEGDLMLPTGFIPSRVIVRVVSNRVTLERSFEWKEGEGRNVSIRERVPGTAGV